MEILRLFDSLKKSGRAIGSYYNYKQVAEILTVMVGRQVSAQPEGSRYIYMV